MRRLRLVHTARRARPGTNARRTRSSAGSALIRHGAIAEGEPSRAEQWRGELACEDFSFDPVVQALLEHVRTIQPLPLSVRARALARARATIDLARS
jgi:hypothetical protein